MRTADNLTIFMCQLCRNLGASTFWIPQGLSKPVMGLPFPVLRTRTSSERSMTSILRFVLYSNSGPQPNLRRKTEWRDPRALRKIITHTLNSVRNFNPLSLELDIYSLAHHLCTM